MVLFVVSVTISFRPTRWLLRVALHLAAVGFRWRPQLHPFKAQCPHCVPGREIDPNVLEEDDHSCVDGVIRHNHHHHRYRFHRQQPQGGCGDSNVAFGNGSSGSGDGGDDDIKIDSSPTTMAATATVADTHNNQLIAAMKEMVESNDNSNDKGGGEGKS
jgi:hypothetical protein